MGNREPGEDNKLERAYAVLQDKLVAAEMGGTDWAAVPLETVRDLIEYLHPLAVQEFVANMLMVAHDNPPTEHPEMGRALLAGLETLGWKRPAIEIVAYPALGQAVSR